jgi:peptidyl-prolyl cis-trans isomerase A (cyclophilin A)
MGFRRSRLTAFSALLCLFAAACSPAPETPKRAATKEAAKAPETMPDSYRVRFETTKGNFTVEVKREWAPLGAERFYRLCREGYYDEAVFFRVVRKFVAQFGIHKDPDVNSLWNMKAPLQDDKRVLENKRGTLSFAKLGPNTRRTQVFINLADNKALDREDFVPFGKIVDGLPVVDELYAKYGETANRGGGGPDPRLAEQQGNAYFTRLFGSLDSIKKAVIEP